MKVPQSILHAGCLAHTSNNHRVKNVIKCQFRTKVVVNDDCINVEGEGAPNVVGLFKGNSEEISSMNRYNCDLADLSVIILQQVDFYIRVGAYMYESSVGVNACKCIVCKYRHIVTMHFSCVVGIIVNFFNRLQARLLVGFMRKLFWLELR